MSTLKAFFSAVLVSLSLAAAAPAQELNTLGAGDVRELTAGLSVPEPREPLAEAVAQKNGLDPVVVTVPGLKFGEIGWGPFELSHILKLVTHFYPKEISEADIVNGLVSFNPRYLFPESEGVSTPDELARMPDNYLEMKLHEIPGYESHNVVIEPFNWSRDPGDSKATVIQLQARIEQIYDQYKATGRPIYVLAHSWGSVLAHTALHRVAAERPDVRIDKLITAGSPLVPGNLVVRMFVKLEVAKEDLEKKVSKPANVSVWRNIWAMRDAYSNDIPAADSNFQADAAVENVEPTLINLILHNKLLKKEARKDLFKIRDIKAWHGSYFYDYKAELNSIQKEISVQVFRPVLAPQVVDCAKDSQLPMCPV